MPEPALPARDACGLVQPGPRKPAIAALPEWAVQLARPRPTRRAGHNRNELRIRASQSWDPGKQCRLGWMRVSQKGSGFATESVSESSMASPAAAAGKIQRRRREII